MNESQERDRFEKWIATPPYEWSVLRYPDDPSVSSWPGQYVHERVQLAWEAWQAALVGVVQDDAPPPAASRR